MVESQKYNLLFEPNSVIYIIDSHVSPIINSIFQFIFHTSVCRNSTIENVIGSCNMMLPTVGPLVSLHSLAVPKPGIQSNLKL